MSDLLSLSTIRLLMGLAFFSVGLFSTLSGLLILMASPYRKEAKSLALHSARIGQKALTDDITAVAQAATALIEAVNNLIRTTSGNAIVLVGVGALFEAASYWMLFGGA